MRLPPDHQRCSFTDPSGRRCLLKLMHMCAHETDPEDRVMSDAPPLPQIFLDAAALISGPRRESYGPVEESFRTVAVVWGAILRQRKLLGPTQILEDSDVALLMTAFKLCRESNKASRENRVDALGYLGLLEALHEKTIT